MHTLASNTLPCPQRTGGSMLPDPTERNVNPLLFQARVRTVQKLVLTLAIHDKNVTMAKTAHVSFTVWTGLAFPFEECSGAEAYRHKKKTHHRPPKQWLIIAMPSCTRIPSPTKVQVRGSRQNPPQHTRASSGVR